MRNIIHRIIQVIRPSRGRPNLIAILLARQIQINPSTFLLNRYSNRSIPLFSQALYHLRRSEGVIERPSRQRRDKDRRPARAADIVHHIPKVAGECSERDIGGGFLVVVAELDGREDFVSIAVCYDVGKDLCPVAALDKADGGRAVVTEVDAAGRRTESGGEETLAPTATAGV
jgi:hypothetical protein